MLHQNFIITGIFSADIDLSFLCIHTITVRRTPQKIHNTITKVTVSQISKISVEVFLSLYSLAFKLNDTPTYLCGLPGLLFSSFVFQC